MNLHNVPFPILGLSGGIASGKSTLARMLGKRGWVHLDADQVARDVVRPGSEGLTAILERFGHHLQTQTGELDRQALAREVFQNDTKRRGLEALLHPRIESELTRRILALPQDTRGVVMDAALWVEMGKAHTFDAFWVADAPLELRIQRIVQRDGLTRNAALARIQSQCSDAEKALHADQVFVSDPTLSENQLREAERALLLSWKAHRKRVWRTEMNEPYDIQSLQNILGELLAKGGDLAEVYMEKRSAFGLGLDDGRMEDLLSSETFGVSLRLMDGETTRFADLIAPSLEELLSAARTLAQPGNSEPVTVPQLERQQFATPSPIEIDPATVPIDRKVAVVRRAESSARAHGEALGSGKIKQVAVGYGDSTQHVWIASCQKDDQGVRATLSYDCRVQGVLRLSVTAGDGEQLQTGFQALGETRGFELFSEDAIDKTAFEAARLAIQALSAKPAPAGTFPVILSSSAGGTMIHEACGHGLEADLALAGMSAFAGQMGQKVANECVTIIDDGTLPHKRGSAAMDDEGNPSQRVVLIEKGILKGYLQSQKTARKMKVNPTGTGRRESYRHLPIARMRNTFLAPGLDTPENILKDLDKGLLVKHMGGGQVDTVTGNFVFQVREGYWVEKGQIQYPLKNATLSGCGPEVLKQIERVANDLEHFDIGTCGKDGQGVPVSDAIPTILCPALVVGGTAQAE